MGNPCSISPPVTPARQRDPYVLYEIQERSRSWPENQKDHIPGPFSHSTDSDLRTGTTSGLRNIHHFHLIHFDEPDSQSAG